MMFKIKREQFIWEFTRIGKIPSIYKSIDFINCKFTNNKQITSNNSPVISITLFPTFLKANLVNESKYVLKKINHKNFSGAGVNVIKSNSIDDFLKQELKSQIRKNLNRTITRLEKCFEISYNYYFGSITEEKLSFLLSNLKLMLEKRFDQKNMLNNFLSKWDINTKDLFNLINTKKASLFVVYDRDKPISISVNRHYNDTILFSDINGYNLDYSKFGLGHLDNYLLVKWCIENEYKFLDLGNGVVEYKKRWCNTFYDFEYHIYYKKGSVTALTLAYFEIFKINIKNTIKKLKVDDWVKRILNKLKHKISNPKRENVKYIKPEITTFKELINSNSFKLINIDNSEYHNIREHIYNQLYLKQVNINNIKVYVQKDTPSTYFIKMPKETIKIVLTDYES
ncbi:GNAT family N-acetyltransferase [Seonamhaeicola sp. S2-3]|uniref:GNAT family N-acetyltransferase n=1 Tax=Seonamhaeicola sp. S2-3 TaxID=1936081 RepID=UPI0009F9B2B2|nr:GNAT family N-acetyltransferase [Seonamhaeicola sp. S2-3]